MSQAYYCQNELASTLLVVACLMLSGCGTAHPNVGHEDVLIEKPLIFGHGGIASDPVRTGLTFIALTTDAIDVDMQPQQFEVQFKDLMSSDGVPLDFDTVIRLQVTDSVALIRNFGENWYQRDTEREFANLVRQAVRKHGMNETAISTVAIDDIDAEVFKGLTAYLVEKHLPVRLIDVTVGKANPPDAIKTQRVETAKEQQRILTEQQRKLAEDSRKAAETSRAEADNAYRNAMDLTPSQFIQLEMIKMQQSICGAGGGSHCTFIVNSSAATPILDARK